MNAQETSGQNSTVKEGSEFPLHESRDGAVTLLLPGEERFKLFGDDAVQHAFFRTTRSVFNRACQHGPTTSKQEFSQLK